MLSDGRRSGCTRDAIHCEEKWLMVGAKRGRGNLARHAGEIA